MVLLYCNSSYLGGEAIERGKIYSKIVDVLRTEKLNIQQISTRTHIRWETVRNAVEALKEAGFLSTNGKLYTLERDPGFDEHTLLGMPVPDEKKKGIAEIANRIKQFVDYNNTFLQKAVIRVIQKHHLDLPYGWYLFGPCCAVRLTGDFLSQYKSTDTYDFTIKETTQEYGKYSNTIELMEDFYQQNPLYYSRLQIDQILNGTLTKNSMRQIETALKHMIFNTEKPSSYYIDIFLTNIAMLKRLDAEPLNEIKVEIITTFRIIWEIVATQKLRETINLQDIDFFYNIRMEALEELAQCYLLALKDYWPKIQLSERALKLKEKYSNGLGAN